jgi:hypothetical protein
MSAQPVTAAQEDNDEYSLHGRPQFSPVMFRAGGDIAVAGIQRCYL